MRNAPNIFSQKRLNKKEVMESILTQGKEYKGKAMTKQITDFYQNLYKGEHHTTQ